MPPPKIHDEHDDDLDDLDDVLDSLTTTAAPTSPLPPPPSRQAAAPPPDDDIGDPDDVGLDSEADDPELARQLEQGMKALFAGLGPGPDGGEGDGDAGLTGMMDDPELAKIMQEMLNGDFAAASGAGTGAGAGGAGAGDDELQKLMAALGMSADDFGLPSEGSINDAPVASTSKAAPAPATTSTALTTSQQSPPPPPANFQDAIAASMSKLRDSSTTADASRAAASSGAGGGDSAGMAAMLAQLAGVPGGGGLPGLEGLDSDEGLQGMLDDMMKQLMSREMLYEPLKELADKYPAYLSAHGASLATADRDRYEKQRTIVCEIVAAFEEPGADVDPSAKLAPEEEQKRAQRTERVVDLVAKMNECGAPPTEIMGEMPPGMELGPDGAPKVPECCIS